MPLESPFKPGVRYFVLPNRAKLDPLPRRVSIEHKRAIREDVRDALQAGGPQTMRELGRRMQRTVGEINGALYSMKNTGEVVVVGGKPRTPGSMYGRTLERIYDLKRETTA